MGSGCAEFHLFSALGRRMAFHVPTMLFYALNDAACDLLAESQRGGQRAARWRLLLRHGPWRVRAAREALEAAGFFRAGESAAAVAPEPVRPLRTIELCVTHACNLACRYCYGSQGDAACPAAPGLLYGAQTANMSAATARAGIDLLLARSGRIGTVEVVFFGGEPFLNLAAVRGAAEYAEARAAACGKRVHFSAVTNGTRLTPEAMAVVQAHRIHVQISIDGAPAVHDANRPYRNGRGSYAGVRAGAARLRQVQRHPPARATAAHGNVDAGGTLEHLLALGFGSVHVEPALWDSGAGAFDADDVETLMRQEEAVAQRIVEGIDAGEVKEYHALTRLVRETRAVRERRRYYCGAGRGLVCLSADGAYYPCHRFAGQDAYRLGTVETGIDDARREPYRALHVDARPGCRDCWARYLCGGGCWDHARGAHGALDAPDLEKACRIVRRRIELAMAVNAVLKESEADAKGPAAG